MGRYLLCEGNNKKPYLIRELDLRLYSPEELCYYINQNIAILDNDFLNEELYSYIEEVCEMPDTVRRMRQVAGQGKNTLDALYLFLKDVCYYNDGECNLFLQKLRKREKMPADQIRLQKAALFTEKGRYEEALKQYERILQARPAHTKEVRIYTDLYEYAGCLAMQMGQFHRGMQLFRQGWLFSGSEELGKKMCFACFLAEEEPEQQEERLPKTWIAEAQQIYERLAAEAAAKVGQGVAAEATQDDLQARKEQIHRYFYDKKQKYRQMAAREL